MELLSENNLKIQEIALKSGFQDTYYFSKFFKQKTGLSPSEFKKLHLLKTVSR